MPEPSAAQHQVLLAGVAWQDQLLAGYRSLTAAASLTVTVAASTLTVLAALLTPGRAWLAALGTLALAVLNTSLVRRMREVTVNRALDVNWWQARVIECEAAMDERPLSDFKQAQHERTSLAPTAPSTGRRVEDLLRKGPRHVRGAIEKTLFRAIQAPCWLLALGAVAAAATG